MMASIGIMSEPRKLKRRKVSKPPAKNIKTAYKKIMLNLKRIGFTRYEDELVPFLSARNYPDSEKKKAADEILNTPGAADALEKIMLEDNNFDVAAAAFSSLFYHRDDVELTKRQEVLFKLLIPTHHDILAHDLENMGINGGKILVDILLSGTTNYSRFSAVHMMSEARFSQEDIQKLMVYMEDIPMENENEKLALEYKLFEVCKGHLYIVE